MRPRILGIAIMFAAVPILTAQTSQPAPKPSPTFEPATQPAIKPTAPRTSFELWTESLRESATKPWVKGESPNRSSSNSAVESIRKAEPLSAQDLVTVRESVLKSATEELDAVIAKVKSKRASFELEYTIELDQLLIDCVTRHQQAIIRLKDAKEALKQIQH